MTLFRDHLSDKLTSPNPQQDQALRKTHPGQAHLAGEGPEGMTCRACIHWQHGSYDYFSRIGKSHGLIKPAICAKATELNGGHKLKPVPDNAEACRHFEFNLTMPRRFA